MPKCLFWNWKRRKTNESWRKKLSYLQNTFFFFLLFGPLLLSKLKLSHFFFILNDLKCYRSTTLGSTNNLCTIITIKKHKKKYLGVQKLVVVCCFELFTPTPLVFWGVITFSFLIHFWRFLVLQMCQEEGFNISLDTKTNNPPLGSGLP